MIHTISTEHRNNVFFMISNTFKKSPTSLKWTGFIRKVVSARRRWFVLFSKMKFPLYFARFEVIVSSFHRNLDTCKYPNFRLSIITFKFEGYLLPSKKRWQEISTKLYVVLHILNIKNFKLVLIWGRSRFLKTKNITFTRDSEVPREI